MSFKIQSLRFIDSYQFLSASLDKLVRNLPSKSLHHARKYFGSNELLFKKGIFPYEWYDSLDKFHESELPPANVFYIELNEGVTKEEYRHAQAVWEKCHCQTFQQYHDVYMKTDVLLLADICENFRDVSMTTQSRPSALYDNASLT